MMGTSFIQEKGSGALNNCAFVSTEDIEIKGSMAFTWTMDALMMGVGVGFDTKGAGRIHIKNPKQPNPKDVLRHVAGVDTIYKSFIIPDSREGWVEALRYVLDGFFYGNIIPDFDYSLVRKEGEPIKGFGGVASGPKPLKNLLEAIINLLEPKIGEKITSSDIVDIFNMIGVCVVAGNVRRSAEIAIGAHDDEEFISIKDYNKHPEAVMTHRWASNNSIFAEVGKTNYGKIAKSIALNGEPGLVWLDNIRNFGRIKDGINTSDKKAMGVNPCGEQTLESYELCCVSKDTKIQTKKGVYDIIDIVDKEVEVWNGDEWSKVKPFLAGKDKDIYRVHLSDGSYLDCTDDHKWSVKPNGKKVFRQLETKELEVGSQVVSFDMDSPIEGVYEDLAYEYGLFSGDGYLDKDIPMLIVCGDKIKLKDLNIRGTWYKEQIIEGYTDPVNRLSFNHIIDKERANQLNSKTKGLPNWVFEMDKESIFEFTAGLIETDGNVSSQENTDSYRIFGNQEKIRDMQILLRRVGINHSSVYCVGRKGEKTNFGTRNYDVYCLYIPSYECGEIPTRIKTAKRIGSRYKINNRYPDGKKIDAARKQKIVKVEKLEGSQDTFCFTEPKNHMGVFGNVLTYQCLVETFPSRHDTYEEYRETLKYAYLYAKTVTLIPTHWEETNAVLMKNRRIGTSQSGIIDAFVKHGRREMLHWCDKGYDYIKHLDEIYSDWLCVPRSKKVTSIKPSGSVSLLPGVSPGIHYPHAEYYYRRVRIATESPLVDIMKKAGYRVEFSEYGTNEEDKQKTSVIVFPVHEKYFAKKKDDVSIWEQVKNCVDYQNYWADNNVSITVTFKENEAKDIPAVLEAFEDKLKAVSFLPIVNHGYVQAPYTECTKEEYEAYTTILQKPDYSEIFTLPDGEKFCDGDSCII